MVSPVCSNLPSAVLSSHSWWCHARPDGVPNVLQSAQCCVIIPVLMVFPVCSNLPSAVLSYQSWWCSQCAPTCPVLCYRASPDGVPSVLQPAQCCVVVPGLMVFPVCSNLPSAVLSYQSWWCPQCAPTCPVLCYHAKPDGVPSVLQPAQCCVVMPGLIVFPVCSNLPSAVLSCQAWRCSQCAPTCPVLCCHARPDGVPSVLQPAQCCVVMPGLMVCPVCSNLSSVVLSCQAWWCPQCAPTCPVLCCHARPDGVPSVLQPAQCCVVMPGLMVSPVCSNLPSVVLSCQAWWCSQCAPTCPVLCCHARPDGGMLFTKLYCDKFIWANMKMYSHFSLMISQHLDGTGSWNSLTWRTRAHLFCTANTIW